VADPNRVEALYREVVLEHYRRPRNRDPLEHPDGSALVDNPLCGDQVVVEICIAGGRIERVSARTRGCSIAVAAASVMTELVQGRDRSEAEALARSLAGLMAGAPPAPELDARLAAFERIAELPARRGCATLPWEALAEAWPTS